MGKKKKENLKVQDTITPKQYRCWGRVEGLSRCSNKSNKRYFPFCKKHFWQPLIFLVVTLPGIFADWSSILPNNNQSDTVDIKQYELILRENVELSLEKENAQKTNEKIKEITGFTYKELAEIVLEETKEELSKGDAEYCLRNYGKAVGHYKKAAKYNNSKALYTLGSLYRGGFGVTKNIIKAIEFYERAAEKGEIRGYHKIGKIYATGEGIAKNYRKALKYYEMGVEKRDAISAGNLGFMYEFGEAGVIDYQKAMNLYEKAVEFGDPCGHARKANMYMLGHGVNANVNIFFRFMFEGSKSGCTKAMLSLARCYLNGIGTDKNLKLAEQWLRDATLDGLNVQGEACLELGHLLKDKGQVQEANWYYFMAAQCDIEEAKKIVGDYIEFEMIDPKTGEKVNAKLMAEPASTEKLPN